MDAAMEGMDTMFHITRDSWRNEAGIGVSVVPAAVQAAVRRVVFASVSDPSISELVNHSANAPVEEAPHVSANPSTVRAVPIRGTHAAPAL
jgi:hypothetical protein